MERTQLNPTLLTLAVLLVAGCSNSEPLPAPKRSDATSESTQSPATSANQTPSAKDDKKPIDLQGGTSGGPADPLPSIHPNEQPTGAPDINLDPDTKLPKGSTGRLDKPKSTVQTPLQSDWKTAEVTAEAVADKADKAIFDLKDTAVNAAALVEYSGGHGQIIDKVKIKDKKTYWAKYHLFHDGNLQEAFQYANGSSQGLRRSPGAKDSKVVTDGTRPDPTPSIDAYWWQDMPRLYLNPLLEGKPVFGPLVSALKAEGFDVKTESRKMTLQGHDFLNYRIVAERGAEATKVKGPAKTEIVFDAARGLPVTIYLTSTPPRQAPISYHMRTEWLFNRQFKPETFKTFLES